MDPFQCAFCLTLQPNYLIYPTQNSWDDLDHNVHFTSIFSPSQSLSILLQKYLLNSLISLSGPYFSAISNAQYLIKGILIAIQAENISTIFLFQVFLFFLKGQNQAMSLQCVIIADNFHLPHDKLELVKPEPQPTYPASTHTTQIPVTCNHYFKDTLIQFIMSHDKILFTSKSSQILSFFQKTFKFYLFQ